MFGHDDDLAPQVTKALNALQSEIFLLNRKLLDLQITTYGMRRKLGFEDSWASIRHDEQYIELLQEELRIKRANR